MHIRPLSDQYAVSPQIDPEDIPAIVAAGYTAIICNRPDAEVPPSHQAAALRDAAKAAGLAFSVLPVTHATLTFDLAAQQHDVIKAATGPVLAYCASGTRSTIVWALGQAGQMPADEIIAAAASQGYDIAGLRGDLTR